MIRINVMIYSIDTYADVCMHAYGFTNNKIDKYVYI